jgi:hypothetical protein
MADATPSGSNDPGVMMMELLIKRIIINLQDTERPLPAAEQEVIRKLLGDNSVTLNSIKRGDFGEYARQVAEEFPFEEG